MISSSKKPRDLLYQTLQESKAYIEADDNFRIPYSKSMLIKKLSSTDMSLEHDHVVNMPCFETQKPTTTPGSTVMSKQSLLVGKNMTPGGSLADELDRPERHRSIPQRKLSISGTSMTGLTPTDNGNGRRLSRPNSAAILNRPNQEPLSDKQMIDHVLRVLRDKQVNLQQDGLFMGQDLLKSIMKQEAMQKIRPGTECAMSQDGFDVHHFDVLSKELKHRLDELLYAPQEDANKALSFSKDNITFNTQTEDITTQTLVIHNHRDHAVHYRWRRNPQIFDMNKGKEVDRFFLFPKKGVILPRSKVEFKVSFKSMTVGVFKEKWTFDTHPAVSSKNMNVIVFKGFATCEDEFVTRKEQIETCLQKRSVETDIRKMLSDIVERCLHQIDAKEKERTESSRTLDNIRKKFLSEQAEWPMISFKYNEWRQLSDLYEIALQKHAAGGGPGKFPLSWNHSILTLYQLIASVNDIKWVNANLAEMELIVKRLRQPSLASERMKMTIKQSILNLADEVVLLSHCVRPQFGLPGEQRAALARLKEVKPEQEIVLVEPVAAAPTDPKKPGAKDAAAAAKAGAPNSASKKGKTAVAPGPGDKGKGGKKGADEESSKPAEETQEDTRPKSPQAWTKERKNNEIQLKLTLNSLIKPMATAIMNAAIDSFE